MLAKWLSMKSEKTISDFLKLSEDKREALLDFLDEFVPYEEIEADGRNFVLCHAGIRDFDEDKALEDYSEEDFIFAETDYRKIYFKDAFLVTGHMPTVAIHKKLFEKPYAQKRHLAIDGGAAIGGKLLGIRLEGLKMYFA